MTASEVLKELKEHANPEKAEHSKRFFKAGPGEYGEGDRFLGIVVPVLRKTARRCKAMSLDEVKKLLHNPYHEVRLTAVLILVYKIEKAGSELQDKVAEFYLDNLSGVNNWDIVDSSAPKILGRYLENKDRTLLYDFARSGNLWKRRISILSCYHFIRNHDFTDALNISELLLNDDHDLIHKAVGWMLREIGNRDLVKETDFLDRHSTSMPRTMLRYAIEKFEPSLRQHYLNR